MVKFSRKTLYDPLVARDIVEIKSNDVFYLGSNPDVAGAAGTVLATTATTANKDLFLTHFGVSATNAASLYVTVGTSTILPISVNANNDAKVDGSMETPLYRAGGATAETIRIVSNTANSTVSAFLIGVYHPIHSKVMV